MRRIHDYIFEQRIEDRPFELIAGGMTRGGSQAVRPFLEAGAHARQDVDVEIDGTRPDLVAADDGQLVVDTSAVTDNVWRLTV